VSLSVFSFQSPRVTMGMVEITGTEGTLIVPDPNAFTGEVKITRAAALAAIGQDPEWEIVPVTGALAGGGMGVLDMARSGRSPRPACSWVSLASRTALAQLRRERPRRCGDLLQRRRDGGRLLPEIVGG
jgi:predicted dehydrogenase